MKKLIRGSRYWEVTFAADGKLLGDTGLVGELAAEPVTELFVFSHGWNSSPAGARAHYDYLFDRIAETAPAGRSLGFVGVLWPSLLFPEDDAAADGPVIAAGDAQGVSPLAAAAPPPATRPVSSGAEIATALADAFPGREDDVAVLGDLLDSRPQDPAKLARFVELARGLITTPNDDPADSGEATVCTDPVGSVLDTMAALAPARTADAQGFNPFGALWDGGKELLRVASYYEMKNRAGVVGRAGLAPLLTRLAAATPGLRIHLLGHSFGARLVAFVLAGLPSSASGVNSPVKSLLLIQGAFSHFTFSSRAPVTGGKGGLAGHGNRVDGPHIATFSTKDRAVGWWYPNASRLRWQDSQDLRNPNFRWGGMGSDGYQQDGVERVVLGAHGVPYDFVAGRFYRFDAEAVVNRRLSWFAGAHSDINQPHLAWLALSAAGLGRRSR